MTASNFSSSLAFVLKDEGGNDDDPQDHGGRTSRGITQREYDKWRLAQSLPTRDVWTADASEISTIYHDDYWEPLCDKLPNGVDYLYFDMAVNGGPHRAAVLLQRSVGVTADGVIGPVTLAAVVAADPGKIVMSYSEAKRSFYQSLNQPHFINGWLNRCDNVQSRALEMLQQENT